MLNVSIAAVAAAAKAVTPSPVQRSSCCSVDTTLPVATHTEGCSWNFSSLAQPDVKLVSPSTSYCQQDVPDANAASAEIAAIDAALESAIFSALDADSSTDIFFPDPKTAALNHLLSQLATTELAVQSSLAKLGCSEQPGQQLYTSQLLQQLLAAGGQAALQAAAQVPGEDCLLSLAAAVKQISCLLPRCGAALRCYTMLHDMLQTV
jgi:hypothetical protein